ncbi:MAG: hypothetical protein R3Y36_00865 [Spirochaetales bacterium]
MGLFTWGERALLSRVTCRGRLIAYGQATRFALMGLCAWGGCCLAEQIHACLSRLFAGSAGGTRFRLMRLFTWGEHALLSGLPLALGD